MEEALVIGLGSRTRPLVSVEPYTDAQHATWDAFVTASRNGTFLLQRGYMDYHRDRFTDASVMIRARTGELIAVCPANRRGDTVASHGGLTYGGFVFDETMKTPRMLEVFDAALTYWQQDGVRTLVYKTIPHVYHRVPAEEDRYALFLCNGRVTRRGVLTVVDRRARLPFQERRARRARKAKQAGLTIRETGAFAAFWDVLTERLLEAYATQPVHRLDEIERLNAKFPRNIRLFGCYEQGQLIAGAVVYESDRVAHVQYIAANARGRDVGALDLLFDSLLTETFVEKPYFDFGTADNDDGRALNRGLIDQKEGFGARAVAHDHYEVAVDAYRPGQLIAVMAPA